MLFLLKPLCWFGLHWWKVEYVRRPRRVLIADCRICDKGLR